jgi:glucokinase
MEKLLCGIDLGGTKLSAGLISAKGRIIDKEVVYDHVTKSEDEVVEQMTGMVRQLIARNDLKEKDLMAVGVGFPGHIRYRDGITITTSNLDGFKNYPLRKALEKNFSIPVLLDNDANAQALSEYKFGAGRGYDSMIFLTISTGIGAGIILNNKLYRGVTGTAGEFGHTIVRPGSGLMCTCGNEGCLMACACGRALPHLFREKREKGFETKLTLPADFDYSLVDGKLLKKGIDIGDPLSISIMNDCADVIGIGLYNIFQVFNPPLIILGGGLLCWGDGYFNRIRSKFYELARDMIFDKIDIVESVTGADAGLIGAAALILE